MYIRNYGKITNWEEKIVNERRNKIMDKIMENDKITISMEEYKELLMIKGRYEELKERRMLAEFNKKEDGLCKPPYRVTL